FMNQVGDDPETVGILLRVPQHQPVKLRQVLLSNTFQHHPSTLAVVLGVTLEQQIILRDLATAGQRLTMGSQSAVRHLTSELLASLTMLNTPAELRLALLGASSAAHREFIHTPHALGRLLDSPENGQRLLDGMVKEVQRRHQWFAETQANTLEAYNAHLLNRGESPLPRILLLLSSLSDPAWKDASESWSPAVYDLIINGGRVGVYMILTAEQAHDVPDIIEQVIET